MTILEAIKIIKSECYVFNPLNLDRTQMVNTALDMAIRSLEAWEKVNAEIEKIEKAYGLDKSTKYGNEDAEQQRLSYSTMHMYEVADIIDEIKEIINKYKTEREEDNGGRKASDS